MINNPEAGIRTDFALSDKVRPSNMNALAQSIQYDYVITDRMLDEIPEAAVTEYGINVDVLLGGGKITQIRDGDVSVLLNIDPQKHHQGQNLPVFYFPCDDVAFTLRVLVYSVHSFMAYIGTPGSNGQARFYFHTGSNAPVGITGIGAPRVYVGAFSLAVSSLTLPANSRFVYELAEGDLPTPSGSGTVRRNMWMTNADLLPVPDMGDSEYKCFRARMNEMAGGAPFLEWVDNLTIEGRLNDALIHESLDTLAIQENTQGDWGVKGTGYEYANMPGYRYLVPGTPGQAEVPSTLIATASGKMEWKEIPDLDVEDLVADGIDHYDLDSGDNYIELPWNQSRATILQLRDDSPVDIYFETDSTTTVHSMLILANAGSGGVYHCAQVRLHWYDELHNARTILIPFPASSRAVIIDVLIKKIGEELSTMSIGRVNVRLQDEVINL